MDVHTAWGIVSSFPTPTAILSNFPNPHRMGTLGNVPPIETLYDTGVLGLLERITHCKQSSDYSIVNAGSCMNSDGIWHMRLRPFSIGIT